MLRRVIPSRNVCWTRSESCFSSVIRCAVFSFLAVWWSDPGQEYSQRDTHVVYKTRACEPRNTIFPLVRIFPLACLFRPHAHLGSVRVPHRRISPDRRGLQATRISCLNVPRPSTLPGRSSHRIDQLPNRPSTSPIRLHITPLSTLVPLIPSTSGDHRRGWFLVWSVCRPGP